MTIQAQARSTSAQPQVKEAGQRHGHLGRLQVNPYDETAVLEALIKAQRFLGGGAATMAQFVSSLIKMAILGIQYKRG